jgi:hypothetical protein
VQHSKRLTGNVAVGQEPPRPPLDGVTGLPPIAAARSAEEAIVALYVPSDFSKGHKPAQSSSTAHYFRPEGL